MTSAAITGLGKSLRKPWYGFWRFVQEKFYYGKNYTLLVPFGQRVLTPWFGPDSTPDFTEALRTVRSSGPITVTPDRLYLLFALARQQVAISGTMAECGVYVGSTAQLLASALKCYAPADKALHLFDTFAGMPKSSVPSRDYHSPGGFSDTSLDFVRNRLSSYQAFCYFHPGLIPETFSEVEDTINYSMVHVDVDIYPSTLACCEWFWPRLTHGGVMVFDDYGFYAYRYAAKAAVDDFFADKQAKPIALPTGQALVFKV